MNRLAAFAFLILISSMTGMGQESIVKGRVLDKKTHQPVIAANLVLSDGTGAYSVEDGRFSIRVSAFPALIKISHIAYGSTEVTLNFAPKTDLVIELEELVSQIGEVQISAKRLRILTEKEDFSLQDFAFDNENLWLLGYTNNQAGKGRLWLASWFGDTLASVPVARAESLFRDVFGAVHLVMKDSVHQLFADNRTIKFPYAQERNEFFSMMAPIRAGFAGKLVYANIDSWEQRGVVFYYDGAHRKPQELTIVENQEERMYKKLELIAGSMWVDLAGAYPVKSGSKVSDMIQNPIKVPLFAWRDTLFVINLYKDSLLSFGPDGKFKRSVPFTYCHDVVLGGLDGGVKFKNLTVMADPVGHGLFALEHGFSDWTLLPINTNTGTVGQRVELPQYNDMYKITVFGNAVYFLYPEKKYPCYVRLFRYQL